MTQYRQTRSGIVVPEYIVVKPKRPLGFSFFAGCGGFDLGFLQAGCEMVGANEWEPYASMTYMVNLCSYPVNIHYIEGMKDKDRLNKACERTLLNKKKKGDPSDIKVISSVSGSGWIRNNPDVPPVRNFWFGDVRKLKGKDILDTLGLKQGDLDVVCGGPPCQGFSRAGKQQITDPRNNLVYEYARMIVELQPKTFVMEEVPDIVNFFDPDGVPVLDKFCMMLDKGGYGKWEKIKKSVELQTGTAAVMRGRGGDGRIRTNTPKKQKKNAAGKGGQLRMDV